MTTTVTRTIVYTYDNLYRLTNATYSTGEVFTYTYNPAGNRTTQTTLAGTRVYTYDNANRLTQVNGQSYTYDNNGNLLNDGSRTFTYDTENRLTSVVSGAVTTTFEYNGDGDRYAQTVNGVTTDYVLDPVGLAQVLMETTSGQSKHYLPGLAQYDATNGWQYVTSDRVGSVRLLVKPNGELVLSQSFDPFGNPLERTGSGQSSFGYTGEQTDPTGLVFLRARYYDPRIGRFISPDSLVPNPLGSQDWNRYAYVYNNPIRHTDPSGHIVETVWDAVNIAIGVGSLAYNLCEGNYTDAALDAGGLALDLAALLIPFVPGGASTAIKVARGVSKVDDVIDLAKTVNQFDNALDVVNQVDNAVDVANQVDNAADVGKLADEMIGAACSFSPDTLVATDEGLIPIGTVSNGELVLAYNEATGELGYYPVTAVWAHTNPVIVYLVIAGERIETTPEHPFYTSEGEWVAAGELRSGDRIRQADGSYGVVDAVEFVSQPQVMYNLSVAEAHTYFVGAGRWLVHNDCGDEGKTLSEWLKDDPKLLAEARKLYQESPEWWGIDPDNTSVFYRSKDLVDEIRKLAGESGGHHPHGLALGGPKGQKLTNTGETRYVKDPTHSKVTGLQRRIINMIKKQLEE